MPNTYTIDQLRTVTVATEGPGTSDAALIQSIAAGNTGVMRIFSHGTMCSSSGFFCDWSELGR
jgi:hypothetical protein